MATLPGMRHLLLITALGCAADPKPSANQPEPTEPTGPAPTTTDTGAPPDTGPTTEPTGPITLECSNEITAAFPEDGATDAYYRTTIEFFLALDEPLPVAITVVGPDGPVAGETTFIERRAQFRPLAPLAPSTAYTATLTWSCPDEVLAFTTSNVGAPVDGASIVGAGYRLNLSGGRWIQPPNIGSAVAALVGADILLGVERVDGDEIQVLFARTDGVGGPQDLCEPTTLFPIGDFSANPYFQVGPEPVTLSIGGVAVPIDAMVLTGAFSADGARLDGGSLNGTLDTAPLAELLFPGQGPFALCNLLSPLGVVCSPCATGLATCSPIEVDAVAGLRDTDAVVVREPADIAADAACD